MIALAEALARTSSAPVMMVTEVLIVLCEHVLMIVPITDIATMEHASATPVGTELGAPPDLAPTTALTLVTVTTERAIAKQDTPEPIAQSEHALVNAATTVSA